MLLILPQDRRDRRCNKFHRCVTFLLLALKRLITAVAPTAELQCWIPVPPLRQRQVIPGHAYTSPITFDGNFRIALTIMARVFFQTMVSNQSDIA